jgi:hypothetical protein
MPRNKSPQTFEKRQRERRKQMKREEKQDRRLERNAEKRKAKAEGREPNLPERPRPDDEDDDR